MKKFLMALLTVLLCLSLTAPAFAAEFTPSVEAKPAPELSTVVDSEGNAQTAIVTDASGNEVEIPDDIELTITSTAEKDESPVAEIQEMLKRAEEQIRSAADLGELTAELAPALEKAKETLQDEAVQSVTLQDLVVQDLFDVSFVKDGKTLEQLLQEGQSVTFALQTNLTDKDLFFVLHNYSGSDWEVVENVELRNDGVLKITLDGLSPVAIVTDGAVNLEVSAAAPDSPQTGDALPTWELVAAAVLGIAAILFFVLARKQTVA